MTNPEDDGERHQLAVRAWQLALRELDRYGKRTRQGYRRRPKAAVIVEVLTLRALGSENQSFVTDQVNGYGVTAAWLESASVTFLIADQRIAKQEVQVRVVPDLEKVADAAPADAEPPLARQLVLTQGPLHAQLLVVVDCVPRPLMRRDHGDPEWAGSPDWVQVPDRFVEIPRGALLYLVRHYGPEGQPEVAVLRSEERPDVHVAIDGTVVVPEAPPHVIRDSGVITFHTEGRADPCGVEYRLAEPSHRRIYSGITSSDPTPMAIDMVARRREVRLLVEPPPLKLPIRFKEFPVPVAGQDVMLVEILYSRAVVDGDLDMEWHIKLYACLTPQHAVSLRRYLRTQSRLIPKVNGAARSAGMEGQVIAPVFLAPPLSETKAVRETGLRTADLEPAVVAEAQRLSIWFGSPEVPQPDSFVVVASPLLEPVKWAMTFESPDLDALAALQPVAHAVALCHAQGMLHGDVTPQNVCIDDNGYVLVDGDAITPLDSGHLLRRNVYYTSRAVSDLFEGRRTLRPEEAGFDFREHDRFGFALLVLTALAGSGTTNSLLVPDGGTRDIDDPDLAVGELQDQWREGQQWTHLIAELTAPFRPGALQREWDPVKWLGRLQSAASRDIAEAAKDPDPPTGWSAPDPFAERIREEVQDEMESGVLGRDVGPVLVALLDARLMGEARQAERRARLWALLPILIGLVLLVGGIVGR